MGDSDGSDEPAEENTGNFAQGHSTVRVVVEDGDTLWYRHLEDNTGGLSGFIINGVSEPVTTFVRGDANSDGQINLTDGISILGYLFSGTAEPACFAAAKATGSPGGLSITDPVFIFTWLFSSGDDPPPPTPSAGSYLAADCGPDPVGEAGLGCLTPAAKCSQ